MSWFKRKKRNFWKEKGLTKDIAPDEIFLDSSNLPKFNTSQFQGRLTSPISKKTFSSIAIFFLLIGVIFISRIWQLQVVDGKALASRSEDNHLRNILQFPERGIIYDRKGNELAWNAPDQENPDIPKRVYMAKSGLSHLLGFLNYPKKDSSGKYYEYNVLGVDGVEKYFDEIIGGENGVKIIEIDALGNIFSESTIRQTENGKDLNLSIDYQVQNKLYELIKETAKEAKFQAGAGIIMDVETGEILAITSYPEFSSQIMTDGNDSQSVKGYNEDSRKPFLNRAVSGLYTPGSIIKPFIALAALEEEIIPASKKILSTGSLIVPNPYDPEKKTVFKDWRAHGFVDMREAIAQSSNVYFYVVGGGFENQNGLGITRIERYLKNFGFGQKTGINLEEESIGLVPNPKWKREIFNDDWRVGDTYITAIGQFGFQATPIQAVRSTAFIAENGNFVNPTILKKSLTSSTNGLKQKDDGAIKENFKIVQEGMRMAVTDGTAKALNFPYLEIAAKTGTAEVGVLKEFVNSWIIGYFPYQKPRYAFVVVMEKRESLNPVGALFVMTHLIDWMHRNTPEYLE